MRSVEIDLVGCIKCGAAKTVVSDSRAIIRDNVHFTRRKRECTKCDTKYWTREVMDHCARPHNHNQISKIVGDE